jgi:NADH-quinone oxidoreductase subunit K
MNMPIPLQHILIFSTLLFAIGVYGVLVRRNVIGILISIELITNAVNVNLIAFSRTHALHPETGQVFVVFTITLAAIAATVGLAIVLALYRLRRTIYTDEINLLKW